MVCPVLKSLPFLRTGRVVAHVGIILAVGWSARIASGLLDFDAESALWYNGTWKWNIIMYNKESGFR
jgi:hypothetical protein